MMMMGIHFMDEVPFKDVYIHALVRDRNGKKMSKSTGNVIDPVDMIDKYGTDALRFTLCAFAAMGRDIKLAEERIEGYRHFANKIWNTARFALMNLPEEMPDLTVSGVAVAQTSLANRWILHRLEEVKVEVRQAVEGYKFNEMAQILYRFIWNELCDWYLEMVKPELYGEDEAEKATTQAVLRTVLGETMVLLHPVMPFITQEIWSALPSTHGDDIATLAYPETREECRDEQAVRDMELFMGVISSARNIRTELLIDPAVKLDLLVKTGSEEDKAVLETTSGLIQFLGRIETITLGPDVKGPKASGTAVVRGNEMYIPLAGKVDFETELARLDKKIAKLAKDLEGVEKKLSNQGFLAKAPAEVVEKEQEKLATMKDDHDKLEQLKARLTSVMG
ncbi:MAG: class I tRNA ligase family protein, partial [Proteobacteria bacterium]|nr:class I tRNA ligase family protein [Pseudomonadota bacterium]